MPVVASLQALPWAPWRPGRATFALPWIDRRARMLIPRETRSSPPISHPAPSVPVPLGADALQTRSLALEAAPSRHRRQLFSRRESMRPLLARDREGFLEAQSVSAPLRRRVRQRGRGDRDHPPGQNTTLRAGGRPWQLPFCAVSRVDGPTRRRRGSGSSGRPPPAGRPNALPPWCPPLGFRRRVPEI